MFHALLLKCENMFCQIIASTVSLTEELHSPNSLHAGYFYGFCRLLIFSKSTFRKKSFRNTNRVSNSLDPDQARPLSGLIGVQTVCKGHQKTDRQIVNCD